MYSKKEIIFIFKYFLREKIFKYVNNFSFTKYIYFVFSYYKYAMTHGNGRGKNRIKIDPNSPTNFSFLA